MTLTGRRRHRVVAALVVSIVAVGVLFFGVFPTRAYLDQRRDIAAAHAELVAVEATNTELSARVDALRTDAEIERLAREQYNLVFPGEEAYAILPAPRADPPADEKPSSKKADDPGFWGRVWDDVTFWS